MLVKVSFMGQFSNKLETLILNDNGTFTCTEKQAKEVFATLMTGYHYRGPSEGVWGKDLILDFLSLTKGRAEWAKREPIELAPGQKEVVY